MQRFSRDLCSELGTAYGMRFHCEHPLRPGRVGQASFLFRSLRSGLRDGWAGWRLHVGDCALLPLGVLLHFLTRAPLSVTACGLDVVYPAPWYQRMLRFSLRYCERIVCISNATAREVKARGVPEERIVIIPPGISPSNVTTEAAGSQRRRAALLSVGRLIPRKGVAWFLERVFPSLAEEFPDLTYTIVGEGQDRARIEAIIHREGLGRRVTLCHALTDGERDVLMEHASLLLMPNVPVAGDMEGFGIVCIEAAGRGLPVVAARMEGIPDAVIDGETGRLFAPGDVQDCLRTIRELLHAPPERAMVAESAWGRFGWQALIHRYQALVFDV